MNTPPALEPPHGSLAARELLADLQAYPPLAPYVLPTVWQNADEINTIASLSAENRVCIAIGLAEASLPRAGERKQGGLVRVGVAVYIFCPQDIGADDELCEQVRLTVLRKAHTWYYTTPGGVRVKALLTAAEEVDLSAAFPKFAKHHRAAALMIEIPLQLSTHPQH